MSRKKLATGTLPELIELQELTQSRQALESHLLFNKDSFVLFKGKRWTYDDLLKLLVQWCEKAKKCGVPYKDTHKYLLMEKQSLERLGLTLN